MKTALIIAGVVILVGLLIFGISAFIVGKRGDGDAH